MSNSTQSFQHAIDATINTFCKKQPARPKSEVKELILNNIEYLIQRLVLLLVTNKDFSFTETLSLEKLVKKRINKNPRKIFLSIFHNLFSSVLISL